MLKTLIFDSNAVINFANKKPNAFPLDALIVSHKCATSFIVKLETLGFSGLTETAEILTLDLLSKLPILPMNDAIEAETIKIRRRTKLKLPDAIIAATAIVIGAELVSSDTDFLKCAYPLLKIWQSNKS
jgi:predicted nucleic acid-binding protein